MVYCFVSVWCETNFLSLFHSLFGPCPSLSLTLCLCHTISLPLFVPHNLSPSLCATQRWNLREGIHRVSTCLWPSLPRFWSLISENPVSNFQGCPRHHCRQGQTGFLCFFLALTSSSANTCSKSVCLFLSRPILSSVRSHHTSCISSPSWIRDDPGNCTSTHGHQSTNTFSKLVC
jgi:hypothetical protein